MIKATKTDKELILDILTASFAANQSVNYIINDNKKNKRIRALMSYSFEVCSMFGEVFFSKDKSACALIVFPEKRRISFKSIILDIILIYQCVGLWKLKKTLRRESLIKKIQPKGAMAYLWFIGVTPEKQGNGIGSRILQDVIDYSSSKARPIFLETSTLKNIPWYQKFGFKIYHEEDIGYTLYFLSNKSD